MRPWRFQASAAAVAGVAVAFGVIATFGYWTPFSRSGITPTANAASIKAESTHEGSARGRSDTAANVSALSRLPSLSGSALSDAQSRASALDYGAAAVDQGSVRRTGAGLVIASRSDGDACLLGRFASSCFYAFRAGGIQPLIQEKRVYDSPQAPFVLMIDGLAEDGVRMVQFSFVDGSFASAPVIDNVFQTTKPGGRIAEIVGYTVDGARYRWARRGVSKPTLVLPSG